MGKAFLKTYSDNFGTILRQFEAKMAICLLIDKSRDKQKNKAIEDLFDKADKNRNGKISVGDYVRIFSDHGIPLR